MITGARYWVAARGFGSLVTVAFIGFSMSGCSPSEKRLLEEAQRKAKEAETETLLVCEGTYTNVFTSNRSHQQQAFTITKVGDKVTKVKAPEFTYTLEKVNKSTNSNKGPIYAQLIVEPDKLILLVEVTEDKRTDSTTLFNTGAYKQNLISGLAEGQCTVAMKAF